MANIGQFNTLSVIAITENGAYLDAGPLGEILLPNRYLPENCQLDDKLNVFIYLDSADRLIATTETPFAQAGEFASLQVKQVNKIGAFLNWGLPKDLLVPFNQQHKKMEVGKHYLVYIFLDSKTERLVASSKLDKYLDIWPAEYQEGQQVELTIAAQTDLGFKAIINHQHWGLIFASDVFKPLRLGQKLTGFIKQIRDDGRINLSLSRAGKGKVIDFSDQLLSHLQKHNGFSPLHDKSSPEEIKRTFGVSKKTFKATIGNLMKKGKLVIESQGIRLP
ncbi:GntR family transcriptional regulator [Thalassotalea insulae]|uniref:GntR family transcriptional regulator n=1 Tax=Thalassotalea insulae TaxID=2056778 RepID=A0ABQ6GQF5_9GAMM|nr:S1-like domain-containing RNA-binding protein [Thalassotalea insulae]GLX77849.1 GntR family transcriptional regulator [Thalassotalea insulae]